MKLNKVSIVGCGRVGLSVAYSLLHRGTVQELVLVSRNDTKLRGEELDLEHGLPFLSPVHIVSTTDYKQIEDSNIVIFSAGASQKKGESRLHLTKSNLELIDSIVPKVKKHAPRAIFVIISNPVDILTYHVHKKYDWDRKKVFGTGTLLDTARFRFHISEEARVNPNSIHTYILGEHGDSSFPTLSTATIGGQKMLKFPHLNEEKIYHAYNRTREAAYQIIQAKGATYYAIGAVTSSLVDVILRDKNSILPLSTVLQGEYDTADIALSVPVVVGGNGIREVVQISLDEKETRAFQESAAVLKKTYQETSKK